MDKETYKALLKKANLTNKKLAELLGTHHQTVNNWTARGYPYWLESWLNNYIKAKTLDSVKDVICTDKKAGDE
ncbi:helix-turn-helix domain-containing protein [Hydrogenimonas thermophila]|uniref:HTH cro/C1-type domain-containing protein n=1 Tax=Hydrogenimonas thermophila TaxID=223786 RepID=A0A1I5LI04_9BACT|nr:helix-turn-helix transcriptional regulator [Hydrogenimonas thermophila]SFO96999.1 hypothetical protein SAMN05216234_10343 [Hydrogenimonas thermophila]